MSTILECKNLSKKYGRKQALDNITLSLESGRIIGCLLYTTTSPRDAHESRFWGCGC